MRYLVTGSRDYSNWDVVRRFVSLLQPGDVVIHGDAANGADKMVQWMLVAEKRARRVTVHGSSGETGRRRGGRSSGDIDIERYPADWARYAPEDPGRKNPAGMIRNKTMLDDSHPDLCVYFSDDLSVSAGTRNMVEYAEKAGLVIWEASEFNSRPRDWEEDDG